MKIEKTNNANCHYPAGLDNLGNRSPGQARRGQGDRNPAFTLVELIIVITILAILATIGFMSFQSYTSDARDSSRTTALRTIHNGLTISYVQKQAYPTPDDYIDIVGVSKQGYIGGNVSKSIRGEGFKDPKDETRYLYSVDYTGKKIQLSGFLENNNKILLSGNNLFLNKALAGNIDYTNRYVYNVGDRVGILLDYTTKAPLNDRISTGSLNLTTNTGAYIAVFSNTSSNSGTISGSGQNLLTNISIVQNSCVLGNTVVTSGQQLTAYNTTTVAYNQTCIPVSRSCNNGVLSGDSSYMYDTCSPAAALNCSRITYNGYSVPVINHNATQTITKNITGGVRDISASCVNGTLSYGTENINCSTDYVLQGGLCVRDVCTGSAPDWSIVNGVQKYNISWTHNITAGQCTFVCQAGYYWNTTACARASAGYMVRTQGQTTQTACTNNNTYQNLTGQTSCKTVSSGYYSTPIGVGAKTGQTQCEANNYCVSGVKTSCPVGTSSPVGSTSSRACTTNTYTVSGSFGTNANGSTVNLCGKTTTADTAGNFTVTANYGTVCNNVTLTKTNYTCTTTTNGPASLTSNISNIAGNCTANTQTYTCTAKPATGTLWNTVSSYTQTWNGTSWAPANSTTAYNTTSSTTSCNYKCNTSYHRESSLCKSDSQTISITDGTCTQTWNSTTGTRNACSSGTCTNGVTWNSTYGCSVQVNGACGTSNGVATRTSPTLNLCSAGTATSVTNGTYTFTWSCNGSNGGTNASCSANKQQTYTCTAKPATGTLWNTVSSYTQTWNGTSWAPANSTTAYNTTSSTTSCNYKCNTSYHRESSLCKSDSQTISITDGTCTQTWNSTTDTRNACSSGTCTNGVTWNSTYGCVCPSGQGLNTSGQCVTATSCSSTLTEITLANGQTWSCKNLGATTVWDGTTQPTKCGGTSTNCNSTLTWLGDYYQWGRNDTGFTIGQRASPYLYGWESQNDTKWGGSSSDTATADGVGTTKEGRQGPCPTGRHVPSAKDFQDMCNTVTSSTCTNGMFYNANIQSVLKIPFAGIRRRNTGYYNNQSVDAYYWSSSPSTSFAFSLNFNASNIYPTGNNYRAYAFSLRCLKN